MRKTKDACEHVNSVGTFFLFVGVILLIVEVVLLVSGRALVLSSFEMESVLLIAAGAGMRGYAGIKLAELEDSVKQKAKGKKSVAVESHPVEPENFESTNTEETEDTSDDTFFDDDDEEEEYIPEPPISDDDPYADVKRLLRKQAQGGYYRKRK